MTRYIVGFDALVTSFIATIATGWSDPCRVGLTPTERPCLCTAHRNDVVSVARLNGRYAHHRCVREKGATSHHRPRANSKFSNGQVGPIVHPEDAVTREALQ